MSRYVLLDRDGVINQRILDGYVLSWSQFVFLPRVLDALSLLTKAGMGIVVVSNQAAVGKGLLTTEGLEDITKRFVSAVEASGGRIQRVYYCPHRPQDNCECRKPKPGLLMKAQGEFRFAFSQTYLIGDSETDLLAAHHVGSPFLLVHDTPLDKPQQLPHRPHAVFPNLYEAAQFLIAAGESSLASRSRDLT